MARKLIPVEWHAAQLPTAGVHLAELPQLAAPAVGKEGEPPVIERNS